MPDELSGQRADLVIARIVGTSRAASRELIESGRVRVGGGIPALSDRLEPGTEIRIELPGQRPSLTPEPIPFDVLYEDEAMAVVDKPSGVVVHPGAGVERGTLAAGLLHRWPELEGVGDEGRWGIAHRLDRDTSGVLAVAKNEDALQSLRDQLASQSIARQYRALAHNRFETRTGTIDAPLGADPKRPEKRAVVPTGKPAITHYEVLEQWGRPEVASMRVKLETGRTHQIRVHLSAIDHPLVGDRTYGWPGPEGVDPGRVWLHARRISLDHPLTGTRLEVEAPMPSDLLRSLSALPASG